MIHQVRLTQQPASRLRWPHRSLVLKDILTLLSERFELRALMEHPQGALEAQKLGIKTTDK